MVIRERDTFDAALTQISLGEPAHFVASLALVTIGYGLLPTIAWATASNEVAKVPALPAAVAWLGAGVTKYVPGLIWHPVSAVERMQRRGASIATATFVLLIDIAAWVTSAILVGLAALPILVTQTPRAALWLPASLPAIALLHPGVFSRIVTAAGRVTRERTVTARLTWRTVLRLVGLHGLGWLVMGLGLAVLLRGFSASVSLGEAAAAAALSWLVGYLFIFAPAGLGVREVALIALLSTTASVPIATAAAVVWRMMFVAIDALGVACSLVLDRWSRRRTQIARPSHSAVRRR